MLARLDRGLFSNASTSFLVWARGVSRSEESLGMGGSEVRRGVGGIAGLGGTGVSVILLDGGLALSSGSEVTVASDDATDSLDSVLVSC